MTWWHYLLLVNIYLTALFGFYGLLLRKETFFQLNRIYLVSAVLLSFIIPFIKCNWIGQLFITQEVKHTLYNTSIMLMSNSVSVYSSAPTKHQLTIGQLFSCIYIAVTLILVMRLVWQLLVLHKAIEKPSPSVAYSFFKKISLGNKLASPDVIAAHEQVHASQWHSVDVLIIEAVMIINWFNPVVYLYRFAIKYIHEFIADRQVIKAGTDKADYAMLLLSQSFDLPVSRLVNTFYNHSQLKRRIVMLDKGRSRSIMLVKYGLSAPLFALMLILSSATVDNSGVVNAINNKAADVFGANASDLLTAITDHAEIPEPDATAVAPNESNTQDNSFAGLNLVKPLNAAFTSIESKPQFPGSLSDFIHQSLKYPAAMREANVQGKVYVQFIVEADGSLSNIKAAGNLGYGSDAEAERVMAQSPKWFPALQNGKAIRVIQTIPINFILDNNDDKKIFTQVEKQPQFPGGAEKFTDFLQKNISYPAAMLAANVNGKVIMEFTVEPDGMLTNIKAVRGPGYGSSEEAERVVALSPKWEPGYQNGKAVRVRYSVPISFMMADKIAAVADPAPVKIFKQPQFPGGSAKLGVFLQQNLRYPAELREEHLQGKVTAHFTVEADGTLSNITAEGALGGLATSEVIRVMGTSPKWIPGTQNGQPVKTQFNLPINFTLNDQ